MNNFLVSLQSTNPEYLNQLMQSDEVPSLMDMNPGGDAYPPNHNGPANHSAGDFGYNSRGGGRGGFRGRGGFHPGRGGGFRGGFRGE